MLVSTTVLALAALAGNALGASIHHRHAHVHDKRAPDINEALAGATPVQQSSSAAPTSTPAASPSSSSSSTGSIGKTVSSWFSDIESAVTKIGICSAGTNANSNNGQAWLGSDGQYTNNFMNNASEAVILVVWGSAGSWVNTIQPLITQSISPGESLLVSFANGASGAFSAIYSDTTLNNGQIFNTWGEYTLGGSYSTVDVSREVNMNGHGLEIQTPQCTTNMNTCVFVCSSGTSCEFGYELQNCAIGSQAGANYGTANYGSGSVPSGGCSGIGDSAELMTFLLD
jgi:hypothetical protein